MNKLYVLISFLLLLFTALPAVAVPDIAGVYSGTCSTVVSSCSNPEDDGTYDAELVAILSQNGETFAGTATCSYLQGFTEYIELSGVITDSGSISGTTTHSFSGGGSGEGIFTGQLNDETLTIENTGEDTSGDTCSYIRSMSTTYIHQDNLVDSKIFPYDEENGDFGRSISTSGDYVIVGAANHSPVFNSGFAYIFERSDSSWNQIARLSASDGPLSNAFGGSVSISGGYAIVGAAGDNINGSNSGAAYIFERDGSTWNQVVKIAASDGAEGDYFGRSVSISGSYAIVGAHLNDEKGSYSGAAYIFERNGSSWSQIAKITASDGAKYDYFGFSVSISGNYAIIGALNDDDNGGVSGSAYIFQRNDIGWNQATKLLASDGKADDYFGTSVFISGDYAIVGAEAGVTYPAIGSAYVFKKSDGSWIEQAKLSADDGAALDSFGYSVAITDDYAVVGAYRDDDLGNRSGSAYIFKRSNNSWTQVIKLLANTDSAFFGQNVSISPNYAFVSNFGTAANDGSVYIYDLISFGETTPENETSKNKFMPWLPLLLE